MDPIFSEEKSKTLSLPARAGQKWQIIMDPIFSEEIGVEIEITESESK